MQSFEGREKPVYEIVSGALNDLTKREAGIEQLEEFLGNIKLDDRKFSKGMNVIDRFKTQTLEGNIRSYAETQLNALMNRIGLTNRYKPNMWIDPRDKRLNLTVAKSTVKSFCC